LEYWNGYVWIQIHTAESSPASGRGVQIGSEGGTMNTMEYISMHTAGYGVDFGDLQTGVGAAGAGASRTRGIKFGGVSTYPGTFTNEIDYIEIASAGNGIDFGNLTTSRRAIMSYGNQTRAGTAGGAKPSYTATRTSIDYVTIASKGDSVNFGDISAATSINGTSEWGTPTRGMLFSNNSNSPATRNNIVEYVTISTTGNAVDFGDMTNTPANPATAGNSVRGMVAGGGTPSAINTIQYFTLTTLGNAEDFGDLSFTTTESSGFSSPIRAVWTRVSNTQLDYTNIASTGNSTDWGHFLASKNHNSALTNCHGGLG
jgi:hypothetical protein